MNVDEHRRLVVQSARLTENASEDCANRQGIPSLGFRRSQRQPSLTGHERHAGILCNCRKHETAEKQGSSAHYCMKSDTIYCIFS